MTTGHAIDTARAAATVGGGFAGRKLLIVINEAYFLVSHRMAAARLARQQGFEVHVAAPLEHVWAPQGFDVETLRQEGFVFHAIPLWKRSVNPLREARTFFGLLWLMLRLKPDVVHLVTIKPNLYGGIAARVARVPAVVYAVTGLGHTFSGKGPVVSALRRLVVPLLRKSFGHRNSMAIFQNASDRGRLVAHSIVREDHTRLFGGAGVDLAAFMPQPENTGAVVVVMAARLIWEKGVAEFVDAARLARANGLDARFVLVGRTHPSNPRAVPRPTLEAWVAEGVIDWWGYREDMPAVLAMAHIVCLPTRYGEGTPKVLLEAAAAGRPAVTTAIPGCSEAVQDGVTGLLVKPGDAADLARALRVLIEDASLRRSMGRSARLRAVAAFDEQAIAADTLSLYDLLLRAGHVPGPRAFVAGVDGR